MRHALRPGGDPACSGGHDGTGHLPLSPGGHGSAAAGAGGMRTPAGPYRLWGSGGAGAFAGCTYLSTVDLSATQLVRIPECLFDYCKNLQKIYLPDTIREIDDFAFRGCSNLKQIKLSNNIQYIGDYAFAGCSSLTDITNIPDKMDFGQKVFAGCVSLTKFEFPQQNSIVPYGMFQFCKSLVEIQLGNKTDRI